jgi:hypothetical protein
MKCSGGFNAETELSMHTSTEVLYGSSLQRIHSIVNGARMTTGEYEEIYHLIK